MARDGAVPPFHGAAAIATPETIAAQKGGAPVSRVAAGSSPLSAGRREENEDADLLLRFFGLKRNPFSGTPEEGFIFYSNAAVRQVYRELITALGERSGIAVLTGEPGIGKTTLLRRLRDELRAAGHLVIARYRAGLFFNELVTVVAEEMQVPAGSTDEVGFPSRLRAQLERNKGARPPVFIIDDAERLGGDVITNLGKLLAGPADHSLRVLLCGRPELATRLELPVLVELRRMLSVSCRLERLDDDDAASYIFHHLRTAGHRGSDLFSSAAINTVVAKAGGLPREIDRLCAKSLTVAAATGKPVVTSEMVEEAAGELRPKEASPVEAGHESTPIPRDRAAIAAGTAAGIIAVGIVIYSLGAPEPASEVDRNASSFAEMGGSPGGISVTHQEVAMSPESDGLPRERRSGNAGPIQFRLQETPQLEQAVQWASNELGTMPGESSGHAFDVTETEPTAAADQRSRAATAAFRAQDELKAGHIIDPAGSAAAARSEPVPSSPVMAATGASVDAELSATPGASLTDSPGQPKPEQASSEKPAVGGEPNSSAALQSDDGMSEPQETTATGQASAIPQASTTENPERPKPEPASSEKPAVGGEPSSSASLQPDDDMSEPQGTTAPGQASATPQASTTENPERPKPEPALSGKAAVGGGPSSSASLRPDDDISELSGTGASGEVQTADMSGSAGVMPGASNEGSAARAVAGPGKLTQAEDAGKSESTAPAAAPAVTLPAASPMSAGSIAALIERGNELFRIGDISAARLAYERAASGGSAAAMTALGMTHDPSVLSRATTGGIRPDPAIAAEWYRKAAALGDAEAAARIQHLPAPAQ